MLILKVYAALFLIALFIATIYLLIKMLNDKKEDKAIPKNRSPEHKAVLAVIGDLLGSNRNKAISKVKINREKLTYGDIVIFRRSKKGQKRIDILHTGNYILLSTDEHEAYYDLFGPVYMAAEQLKIRASEDKLRERLSGTKKSSTESGRERG